MGNLGFGVMLGMLGGNEKSVKAYKRAEGQTITALALRDDALHFKFADGFKMRISDEGQSCCESRYMCCDDDLAYHIGAKLVKIELREAAPISDEDDYGVHEVQFCDITTDRGLIQLATHNEHNGYYGGFWILLTAE
ncbi:MAG: DUF7448 domain-containing protein [Methylocystis sp.]|uniref:DUF7448 domain-containing protein n=1 Tax=Methylocystis sp. TaxID=1911079 RepID=UPI003DA4EABB